MAQLKVPPHVIEKILNHTTGTLGGVAGIYNRFGYLSEMKDALDQWANHLARLVATEASHGVSRKTSKIAHFLEHLNLRIGHSP